MVVQLFSAYTSKVESRNCRTHNLFEGEYLAMIDFFFLPYAFGNVMIISYFDP